MTLLQRVFARMLLAVKPRRLADFIIMPTGEPYMFRWYVVPKNKWCNVYLHRIVHDDDDRALHDHPWPSLSLMLWGELSELYRWRDGKNYSRTIKAGALVFRPATFAHRLALTETHPAGAWTLFLTGPVIRQWGFLCPAGWRHWREFTAGAKGEQIGRGCD